MREDDYEPDFQQFLRETRTPSIFKHTNDKEVDVNAIYDAMLTKSTGGTRVLSMKAPPISTEYVRSEYLNKARIGVEGSLLEAELPSRDDVQRRQMRKHGRDDLFGYKQTEAADAFPAGYGERAAQSLQREDSIYQLKSTFTTAALSMSKLRARVAARGGNAESISQLFAKMWGIAPEEANLIPEMDIQGSEATRLAAMEDRAYHSLSGHPGHTGGFRVDMASVTPEVFGQDTPINWARVRTGAKAIMHAQTQGDVELTVVRQLLPPKAPVKMSLSIVQNSQPKYRRTIPWELALDVALHPRNDHAPGVTANMYSLDFTSSLFASYKDSHLMKRAERVDIDFSRSWMKIATIVRAKSRKTLDKTVRLIELHSKGRALLEDEMEEEVEILRDSVMGQSFDIPAFKVTKERLTSLMIREKIGKDTLPDMKSHGDSRLKFDASAVRAGGLDRELTFSSALNLAVFVSTMRKTVRTTAYALMNVVKDPDPQGPGKLASRLRNQKYFAGESVRRLGKYLFDDGFIATAETVIRNMVPRGSASSKEIAHLVWDYLVLRTGPYRAMPIEGGIPELVEYLRDSPEGWTLYYWARISIGKWHHATQSGILAPIRAGDEMDLLVVIKRGVAERAASWASFYQARYKQFLEEARKVSLREEHETEPPDPKNLTEDKDMARYIPPHLRERAQLEMVYEQHSRGTTSDEDREDFYRRMAMSQIKRKFFKNIVVKSYDREISVGVSDDDMREALIEAYQARWLSIQRRLELSNRTGKTFRLGSHIITEHPWGELQKEFPEGLSATRRWAAELPEWVWTVPPDEVWMSLSKSISELWDDIAKELANVLSYIDECGNDSTDKQAMLNLGEDVDEAVRNMQLSQPTPLPSFGYTPPYRLPEKNIIVEHGDIRSTVEFTRDTTTSAAEPQIIAEGEEYVDEDDDDEAINAALAMGPPSAGAPSIYSMMSKGPQSTELPTLTYRELWKMIMGVEVDEDRMRLAFTLGAGADLDAPHVDNSIGPVIKWGEEKTAQRAWHSRLGGMAKRAGVKLGQVLKSDM